MLTGYQTEVVAFTEGDNPWPICPRCATLDTSTVTVEKAERGLDNAYGLRPVIRYTAEEWADEDGLACDRCSTWIVEPEPRVRAFQNDGEWYVAPEEADVEACCGQCDACGSFDPDAEDEGEPGPGFILAPAHRGDIVVCGCCGSERPVDWRPESEVVF